MVRGNRSQAPRWKARPCRSSLEIPVLPGNGRTQEKRLMMTFILVAGPPLTASRPDIMALASGR